MEMGKKRPRYYTNEQIRKGHGIWIEQTPDFPRTARMAIVAEIQTAYDSGRLKGELLNLARLVGQAMMSPQPTLSALRAQLQVDGPDIRRTVRRLLKLAPTITEFLEWEGVFKVQRPRRRRRPQRVRS